jgi:hypothetical protein
MDYGLLSGLTEGLRQGMQSYGEARDARERREALARSEAQKKKEYQFALERDGRRELPDGTFEKTPEQRRADAIKEMTNQAPLIREGKEIQYDEATGKASLANIPGWKPKKSEERLALDLKTASELRREYNNLPEVKNSGTILSAHRTIQTVAKNPSAAGDLSLIFSYMKLLDPESSVREG